MKTTTIEKASKAATLRARIAANVADEAAGRITWEEFHERQIAAWDAIRAAGARVENAILAMMRAEWGAR